MQRQPLTAALAQEIAQWRNQGSLALQIYGQHTAVASDGTSIQYDIVMK